MASKKHALLAARNCEKALTHITEQISSHIQNPVIVGIETGGARIAKMLAAKLQCPLGLLNISFYRDDFQRIGLHPKVTPTRLPMSLDNKNLVLVDDVIYTGRTVRAALNEIFDYGRPASVTLAVMINRNGRELPIQPDFAGIQVKVDANEHIRMSTSEQLSFVVVSQ